MAGVKIVSKSANETQKLGLKLAGLLSGGEVISLEGELGAGKTVFVKGLAEGLGIAETVTSPTFVILKQSRGRLELNHFDVYRIDESQFIDLGYRDYFYSDAVNVVEWGEKVSSLLPEEHLTISFVYGEDSDERLLTVKPYGKNWDEKVEKWLS